MRRIAFYGGSFDPPHNGHLAIARALTRQFSLDEFVFIPAFHAPHKLRLEPTSAYDRFAMLCLATQAEDNFTVDKREIMRPEPTFSVDTLGSLNKQFPDDKIFFVMGADSWQDILTWREWETVLTMTNHIVVTRPGHEIKVGHVTDSVRERIVDLRGKSGDDSAQIDKRIYFTDVVQCDVSATEIRRSIRDGSTEWRTDVPDTVAKYILKYQIYK